MSKKNEQVVLCEFPVEEDLYRIVYTENKKGPYLSIHHLEVLEDNSYKWEEVKRIEDQEISSLMVYALTTLPKKDPMTWTYPLSS